MSLKNHVLKVLEENRDHYISGQTMANELNVTRSAVWKCIKQLEGDGYCIEGVQNRGYKLAEDSDILSPVSIKKYFAPEYKDSDIFVYKTVGSTNDVLKKMALDKAKEGTLVVAEEQTHGKGRKGKSFFSPYGKGIYMSILLYPSFSVQTAGLLTSAAAVAVAESIDELCEVQTGIKWVNDVFIKDKKACGILTEASMSIENHGLEYVIVGIGINIELPETGFPSEIESKAAAVFQDKEKIPDIRSKLCANIVNRFTRYYKNLEQRTFLDAYKKKLFFLNQKITVVAGKETTVATALDIDENCHLLVRMEDGTEKYLDSGEISIIPGNFSN